MIIYKIASFIGLRKRVSAMLSYHGIYDLHIYTVNVISMGIISRTNMKLAMQKYCTLLFLGVNPDK